RAARPDIALAGDFIVGFPGETEEDFQATLDLCDRVRYAQAYSFKYSARPGTPAAGREEVPEDVKSERLHRLQALLSRHQAEFQQSMVGRTLPVLLEKPGRMPGQMVGRSPYLQAVHLQADPSLAGTIVDVRITAAEANSLAAERVS
ncbi:MAG: TRAM domain-containing protein, partial [Rhodobacteraceae bacterium]|nr:TRAM domain-containing protein [Paracoccaceae bacterium]